MFLTSLALVGHLTRVEVLMLYGLDALGEHGGAGFALEDFAPVTVDPHVTPHAFGGSGLVLAVVAVVLVGGGMFDGV